MQNIFKSLSLSACLLATASGPALAQAQAPLPNTGAAAGKTSLSAADFLNASERARLNVLSRKTTRTAA